ncbi:tRNA pseudouridine(55) synthase TruB [Patescibacteria group bacterium]|nr:tRNA pseudouridine(55) synthase TruB [Patescibacteria group bacterium]MBU1256108.1 tRNA pseudouridine(55) synthase TruB [Patescibacteria group bacterium]MBU1457237.1 tRNA pseudouridine(55) synthase TruB [Patescibacteria group bacterium]
MNSCEGILLIDKPTGLTSHDVVNVVRKKIGVKKVGHTGTLDPLATGLLIILVGRRYTKKQSKFLKQNKQYQVTIKLGVETDTYDSDGEIVGKSPPASVNKITKQDIVTTLKKFQGEINQTVPPFSAVKVDGKKLYQLARQKKEIKKLPVKKIIIKKIKLISFNNKTFETELLVDCSSGTYIRSLAHDIGESLGVGAHVTKLRRTKIGSLSVKKAIFLQNLQKLAICSRILLA